MPERVISGRGTTKYTKYTKAGGGKGETLKWGGQNAKKHPTSNIQHRTSNIEHPMGNPEP
jgi:hypothetical protein